MCYRYNKIGNVLNDRLIDVWGSNRADDVRGDIHNCKVNCHELINCYFKDEYPFNSGGEFQNV